MTRTRSILSALMFVLVVLPYRCMPLRDLDYAASGLGASGRDGSALGGTIDPGGTGGAAITGAGGGTDNTGTFSQFAGGAADAGGAYGGGGSPVSAGGMTGSSKGGTATSTAGTMSQSGGGTPGLGAGGPHTGGADTADGAPPGAGGSGPSASGDSGGTPLAPDLPNIVNSPVGGEITFSEGASWDIDGKQWPAFEIHTPTANYWLVKADAAIVSITDSSGLQWINFSSGFRPHRGVPNLGGCCEPGDPNKLSKPTMTTVLDPNFSRTSNHLRLISKSPDASYWLVWDFFTTHFTLTVNRAAGEFGFMYRGVPGGAIDADDQVVLSNGASRPAKTPFNEDLPGPAEWVYFTHPVVEQCLFLIQHGDDALPEDYEIADGDTEMFQFGGGHITGTPLRFSLGLVANCQAENVTNRIGFVRDAIH